MNQVIRLMFLLVAICGIGQPFPSIAYSIDNFLLFYAKFVITGHTKMYLECLVFTKSTSRIFIMGSRCLSSMLSF